VTAFELTFLLAEALLPPLHKKVRRQLIKIARSHPKPPHLLDVGGRKSHYTIGVPALITITDLPRKNDLQKRLNLGINEEVITQIQRRRSNVHEVLFDDMTQSSLPDSAFHCVVAVEVLEHVEEDEVFIQSAHRVLRVGGVFLMTTPNGDYVINTNPDHKRHYTRSQLEDLLSRYFDFVVVEYCIQDGLFRRLGLKSWSLTKPLQTLLSMTANVINTMQSSRTSLSSRPRGTKHLMAVARKHC